MGRHAGWLAASSGLAQSKNNPAPHIILLPEVPFNENKLMSDIFCLHIAFYFVCCQHVPCLAADNVTTDVSTN